MAHEVFLEGMDLYLGLDQDGIQEFNEALEYDDEFSLAYIMLARQYAVDGKPDESKKNLNLAKKFSEKSSKREQGLIGLIGLMLEKNDKVIPFAMQHIEEYPNDVVALSQLLGPFGILAFSGKKYWREENLEIIKNIESNFDSNDWWFETTKAFIYCENQQLKEACKYGERAWQIARNGNCAHTISHIHYDTDSYELGRSFILEWSASKEGKNSRMKHHLMWHDALLALKLKRFGEINNIYENYMLTDKDTSPLEYLADNASMLWYCKINGIEIPDSWMIEMYNYANSLFPDFGFNFADMHKIIAATSLNTDKQTSLLKELEKNVESDVLLINLFNGLISFLKKEYKDSEKLLSMVAKDEAKFGGSNVQRKILKETLERAIHLNK
tara:strand:+ start:6200 stop:7354 length:1155 start_codon:yes stop_codon:yes gene_type:complete